MDKAFDLPKAFKIKLLFFRVAQRPRRSERASKHKRRKADLDNLLPQFPCAQRKGIAAIALDFVVLTQQRSQTLPKEASQRKPTLTDKE